MHSIVHRNSKSTSLTVVMSSTFFFFYYNPVNCYRGYIYIYIKKCVLPITCIVIELVRTKYKGVSNDPVLFRKR